MLANLLRPRESRSVFPAMSQASYLQQLERFSFAGSQYVANYLDSQASAFVTSNPAVAAVTNFRVSVFSEATFKYQQWQDGRPGRLFGSPSLSLLEEPWAGAGTSHLLAAVEIDTTVYGNSYWINGGGFLVRLDPKKVTILTAEVLDTMGNCVGHELVGYSFQQDRNSDATTFLPSEVAHVRLLPDPDNNFRGTSWIRSVLADAAADQKMTGYKQSLLDNSAVPGMVLRAEPGVSEEEFDAARDAIKARHTGWDKVGRTMLLGAGFDVKVVGSTMQQLDMKALQGAGESRIAAASGVSPVLAGFSEGLQGSSLNTGNYGAARRRFADGTMRPLWRAVCTAFATLVPVPAGARLWFDEREVSFLQEDVMDAAEIKSREALTIESFVRAGFEPDAAVQAVMTGDFSVLKHTGLYSVQLQPPGTGQPAPPARTADVDTEARTAKPDAPVQLHLTLNMPEQRFETTIPVQNDVHLPEQRADVTVQPAQVTVNVEPTPVQNTVNVEPTPVHVDARTTVEPAVVNVPAASVVVMPAEDDGPSRKSVKFTKDSDGHITGATVIEE